MTKSSDAPKTNSARKPPQTSFIFNRRALDQQTQEQNKQKKTIDPRFNPHVYHGNAIKQNVEAQYSFLGELAQQQHVTRLTRMKTLKKEFRIRSREERERQRRKMMKKNKQNGSSKQQQEEEEEQQKEEKVHQDNDDDEEEEEEEDDFHEGLEEEERIQIGLMKDSDLEKEMGSLRAEINKFKMLQGERKAGKRKSEVRKKWAKNQLVAVKTGKQKRAFFLNDKHMKMNETKEELQKMKKSGAAAVNSFVEKKLKKKFDIKHLRR